MEKKYCTPFVCAVVNFPTYKGPDGKPMARALELFDALKHMEGVDRKRIVKISPLWSNSGHSGGFIVEFGPETSMQELCDSFSLEKHFDLSLHGRKNWNEGSQITYEGQQYRKKGKEGLHGWLCVQEDYEESGPMGAYLRVNATLKSLSQIQDDYVSRCIRARGLNQGGEIDVTEIIEDTAQMNNAEANRSSFSTGERVNKRCRDD